LELRYEQRFAVALTIRGCPHKEHTHSVTRIFTTPPELGALLAALESIDPKRLTACPGWTAHHLAAHIAGNYEEVHGHIEAFAAGHPLERTRNWEEREQPLRDLDHATLLARIDDLAAATTTAVHDLLAEKPDAELIWTKRTVPISGLLTHMRSEDALHRWDLVGDDETSLDLLSQQNLLTHAVTFIGSPLLQRGRQAGSGKATFVARVRSPGGDDLVVESIDGDARLSVGPPEGEATIEGDPAARLLLLWGRKPSPFFRLQTLGDGESALRVQNLLSGY
jgi:uncharacterized protein (TIGR03083 family)